MNVDRMRRALERAEAAREEQDRREWFANMTPEHRALHERPFPAVCGFCLRETTERLQAALQGFSRRAQ
jgi:hypothetical protein